VNPPHTGSRRSRRVQPILDGAGVRRRPVALLRWLASRRARGTTRRQNRASCACHRQDLLLRDWLAGYPPFV